MLLFCVKRELGGKWALGVAAGQCAIAWIMAFLVMLAGLAVSYGAG